MKKIFTKEEKETINSYATAIENDASDANQIIWNCKQGYINYFLFDDTKTDEPENEEELERFLDKLEDIQGMISEIKEMILLPKVKVEPERRATKKAAGNHLQFIEEIAVGLGNLLDGKNLDGSVPPPKVNKIPDGWYLRKEGNCNFLDRYNDDVLNLQFIRIDDKFEAKKLYQDKFQKVEFASQEQLKELWIQNIKDSKPFPNN